MTLKRAVEIFHKEVDAFEADWKAHAARGENYPAELPSLEDWFEQFDAFTSVLNHEET